MPNSEYLCQEAPAAKPDAGSALPEAPVIRPETESFRCASAAVRPETESFRCASAAVRPESVRRSSASTDAQREFLARERSRARRIVVCRALLFVLTLGLWEASADLGLINAFIFSSPSRIARCLLTMAADGSLWLHTGVTVLETLTSFFLVTACGILGAVLLWSCRTLAKILDPYLVMLNSLPKSALAPILIVWLGNNTKTIITAAVSVAVFGSILTLHNGFLSTDPDQIRLIRSLGGGRKAILTKVLLPGSVPLIVNNMKVNIGLCLVGVIIGEFLAAQAGLGYLIIYGSQVFKLDLVMTSIAILCLLSALLYQAVAILERRVAAR